jgi:hypothetical protein
MKTPYFMKYFMNFGLLYELKLKPRFLNETNHESGGQFHIVQFGDLQKGKAEILVTCAGIKMRPLAFPARLFYSSWPTH